MCWQGLADHSPCAAKPGGAGLASWSDVADGSMWCRGGHCVPVSHAVVEGRHGGWQYLRRGRASVQL